MGALDIGYSGLALSYLLLIPPLGAILWLRIPVFGETLLAAVRMAVQLLLVGLYLQVVFELNSLWLTVLWLVVMLVVADISILRSCRLRIRRFLWPLFASLLLGTAIPLLFFVVLLLKLPDFMDARYVIPIGGMILGNCLRADIIGMRSFYDSIRRSNNLYLQRLAGGATLREAVRPFFRDACRSALGPTIATMSTIGLVALPGMMTGVILGGTDPMIAIKYQIAIILAIFCGTAITVVTAILLTLRSGFDRYGMLRRDIFPAGKR